MSCAACSARVEKAVGSLADVSSCSVNLLTGSMRVEGDADVQTIVSAVEKAGYGASPVGKERQSVKETDGQDHVKREIRMLKARLFSSLGFLAVLMYVSMGGMLGLPMPQPFADSVAMSGLLQMILSAVILMINRRFFINGAKGVLHRAPNMDTLVALGSGVSFLYSTYVLFAVIYALESGAQDAVHGFAHAFYFESAGMILTLITLGKLLEARAKGKTTDAIRSLLALSPAYATVERGGREVTVASSEVVKGDIVILRPGDRVPVDGVVIEGESAVDESALTGESIPVDKNEGMALYAATVNLSGFLKFRATGVGEETALARIVRMVKDASATKAPIAKVADRVSGVFVPAVLVIALVTFLVWLIVRAPFGDALGHAIAVLVISCPCALGLATPVAIMVGSGVGAKAGILFKTAASLEETGRAKIIVFDKTGTLTEGKPSVTDVIPAAGKDAQTLLRAALSVEALSEHPLAYAVVRYGEEQGVERFSVKGFRAHAGNGVSADCDMGALRGGKLDFVLDGGEIPQALRARAEALADEGKTPLWFSLDGALLGMIAVADTLKSDSADAIARLKKMGMRTVMLTGDNRKTAAAVAARVGIDEVIAEVFPDGKAETVKKLKKQGKLIMVGDGINDAPALTEADIGIAVGAGTDIALDAADVVLTKNTLADVPAAIALSRSTLRNIRQNLFWAFFYNAVGIPLAAGLFTPILGWSLPPMFGAAAMSLSSVTVVSNALRLRFAKIYEKKTKRPTAQKQAETERKTEKMETKLVIEGMMCPHCSGRVKAALEALPAVASAEVSHETGTAVVTLKEKCETSVLEDTVTACGYKIVK